MPPDPPVAPGIDGNPRHCVGDGISLSIRDYFRGLSRGGFGPLGHQVDYLVEVPY